MKKNLCLFLLLGFVFLIHGQTQAQTAYELLVKGAKDKHYVAIKGGEIEANKKVFYIFSSLTRYQFKLVGNDGKPISMKVYRTYNEEDKKDKEVASNFNAGAKTYNGSIEFKCGETGRYYIVFELKE
jgi:hypothetical protein